ncbi:MAG: DUF2442 domain-containing protein [Candidatus Margulisbacteria bacterium]|nr:DUF2442 domain-containing protein [Candidatus Margulisiibacteriota bacterium]
MNTLVLAEPKASSVKITEEDIIVSLIDGREIKVPLVWFPKLFHADTAQKNNYRLIGNGVGLHWPEIDEDLSVAGFLGVRAR